MWLWCSCDIPFSDYKTGNSIESFMEYCKSFKKRQTLYFHNLKYDGSYIINYLLKNGYIWKNKINKEDKRVFTTLISNLGQYYCIQFDNTIIYDSLKIIPIKVSEIAKAFKMEESKGVINYDKYRDESYTPSDDEINYILNDVKIVSNALDFFFKQGLKKITQGSNALYDYKKLTPHFNSFFPVLPLEIDQDIRRAYKGGFVYLNPKYKNKIIKEDGYVIDYNSLYPSVMYMKPLPKSQPIFFDGQYKFDKNYPLYIQHIRCQFKIKPNHLPTIQIKNNFSYVATEYLTDSGNEIPELYLTNIDLCLFFEHYEIYNLEFINGWKFRQEKGLFNSYIDKWSKIKIESKQNNNYGMYFISKRMLNSLYGKFGTNKIKKSKKPILKDNKISYEMIEPEITTGVYIPMAVFITAWARNECIRAAQKIYETGNYIYSDTDSIHALGEIPSDIKMDSSKLGCWKQEFSIKYCKYLRAKTYVDYGFEDNKEKLVRKITVAGMHDNCKKRFKIKEFNYGKEYENKLSTMQLDGGMVVINTTFKIKLDK